MEKEALRRVLLWFAGLDIRIRSVTSDHCLNFKHVIEELNSSLTWDMKWFLDYRYLSRPFVKALWEVGLERCSVTQNLVCWKFEKENDVGFHAWLHLVVIVIRLGIKTTILRSASGVDSNIEKPHEVCCEFRHMGG